MDWMESRYPLNPLIAAADRTLRAGFAPAHPPRPVPDTPRAQTASAGGPSPESGTLATILSDAERRESAALMRVNHAGEIAAQALYHGQALVSRSAATRQVLLNAAKEESD